MKPGTLLLCGILVSVLARSEAMDPARPKAAAGLTSSELGLIIDETNPTSVQIGEYYRQRRSIPAENIVRIRIPRHGPEISAEEFARIKSAVDQKLPARVQALALAWTEPFRVECMSVTSAFAFGFDPAHCAQPCKPTPYSPYFDSDSHTPYSDFGLRPAMSLAATDTGEARALIDRGVASDATQPTGSAYLLETDDAARSTPRSLSFSSARALENEHLRVRVLRANAIANRRDVLFYFIGAIRVPDLETNHFIPGAIADHLTSSGGVLIGGGDQMSSLRWLDAGATGSYGTVVEPCSFPGKFPSPAILMKHYLDGETLIEAYWKSVSMPSQGIFIGEPLAAPFATRKATPRTTR